MNSKGPVADNIKLTVLMPVYNAGAHLKEAVESILTQTYSNFWFLIIDDGSTDGSVDLLRTFKDDRIRLVCHEQNMGIQYTLNEGIDLADTELIARMDADDISHPWRLQKQVDYLSTHANCAMITSLARIIDGDRNDLGQYDPYGLDIYYGLYFDCYICHPSVMYRKNCVEAVGKYSMQYAEDFDLWYKLSRVYKMHFLAEPLLLYRKHEQNVSRVVKRTLYDEAEYIIVKRNLRDVLGGHVEVPEAYIDCYNYNYEKLLRGKDINEVKNCMALLDDIHAGILSIENPNRNVDAILWSSAQKKGSILYGLGRAFPYLPMVKLLLHFKRYRVIGLITVQRIKRKSDVLRRRINEILFRKHH